MIKLKKEDPKDVVILGIDPSLNGTALVKMKNFKVIDFLFFTSVLKIANNFKEAVLNRESGVERLDIILDTFQKYLDDNKDINYIGIEDYAYGAKSNSIFQIGGLGESMRLIAYRNFISYRDLEPSKVKKFATGRGNAEKSEMVLGAYKDGFDVGKYGKNGEDLADAYWIAKMVCTELFIRSDSNYIKSLDKNRSATFTDVSKAYPIPLINRPFILDRRK